MANLCKFKIVVKGRKNACAAFYASTVSNGGLSVMEEHGTVDNYYLRFEGGCNWSVDYRSKKWDGPCPVTLPAGIREAGAKAMRDYSDYSMQDRSGMFRVEVLCNSADLDNYDGAYFVHYKNGAPIFDKAPEELAIRAEYCSDEEQEDSGEPHEPDRIKAYYESDEKYGNWFQIKYHNSVLKEILEKYHYVSEAVEDLYEFDMDDKIENYAGVNTIEELTLTLFGMYLHLGTADKGFSEELHRRKQEIIQAFSFIEGNSQEGFYFHKEYEEDVFDGFDFALKNGVYTAKYRFGVGW